MNSIEELLNCLAVGAGVLAVRLILLRGFRFGHLRAPIDSAERAGAIGLLRGSIVGSRGHRVVEIAVLSLGTTPGLQALLIFLQTIPVLGGVFFVVFDRSGSGLSYCLLQRLGFASRALLGLLPRLRIGVSRFNGSQCTESARDVLFIGIVAALLETDQCGHASVVLVAKTDLDRSPLLCIAAFAEALPVRLEQSIAVLARERLAVAIVMRIAAQGTGRNRELVAAQEHFV